MATAGGSERTTRGAVQGRGPAQYASAVLRGLALVLLVCGLGLVGPTPAQAAVTLTVRTSATTLDEGDRVTLVGTARGARPGSTLHLQRRVGEGWQTVASRTVTETRRYSFAVTPPRGRPAYRVVKPRGLGQAAATSETVRLTVRWQPTLTTSTTYRLDDQQRSVTRIRLDHTGLGGVTVTERRLEADPGSGVSSWVATGRTITLPQSGSIAVDRVREARGNLFAYDAPARGARKAASSDAARVDVAPVRYELTSGPLRLRDLRMGTTATVTFDGVAGQLVGMAYGNVEPAEAEDDLLFSLHGPDGRPLPHGSFGTQSSDLRYGTQTVRLPQTGTYRLDVRRYNSNAPDVESLDVWMSTPKVVQTDDPEHRTAPLSADWPGQGVLYRFPVSAAELVVQSDDYGSPDDQRLDGCPGHRSFSVDGTPISPWELGEGFYGDHEWGLLSPSDGTLSALWTPCVGAVPLSEGSHMRTHRVETADITLGGESAGLTSPGDMGDRIRFRFTGEAGQRIEFFHEYAPRERVCCPYLYTDDGSYVAPGSDGTTYTLPVTGTYHLLFGRDTGTRTIGVREVRGN